MWVASTPDITQPIVNIPLLGSGTPSMIAGINNYKTSTYACLPTLAVHCLRLFLWIFSSTLHILLNYV